MQGRRLARRRQRDNRSRLSRRRALRGRVCGALPLHDHAWARRHLSRMTQLPRVANAILDDRKITQYLLSTVHPTGASKAKFFISFGFSPGNWAELKTALLDHPRNNPVTSRANTPFGSKIRGQLLARGAGPPKPLLHVGVGSRAAKSQSEVHHRVSKPLSGRARPRAQSRPRRLRSGVRRFRDRWPTCARNDRPVSYHRHA